MDPVLRTITYLKSYCNRQRSNISSVLEESIRRNRSSMKLYTKIMLYFHHHTSTGHKISKNYYGGDMILAGTSQENKFSRDTCYLMSYY